MCDLTKKSKILNADTISQDVNSIKKDKTVGSKLAIKAKDVY